MAHIARRPEDTRSTQAPVDIIVIPHSHWDREWYQTFEEFRFNLVHFMDELIELLESDEGMRHFMLDGQVSLVEDYLEVRSENRDRLRRLIQDGRIEIGPWYVQPDEFLISGESLVRNLLIGDREARDYGPTMKQGYVPDTFGHVDQLPQILKGFNIGTFYFMRGLGEDVGKLRSEFWWEAPNGSKVMAHFLSESYSNAAMLGSDPEKMSFRHEKISDPSSYMVSYDSLFELRDRLVGRAANGTILLLNGSDHVTVQSGFSRHVFDLNRSMPERLFNGRLEDFERLVLGSGAEMNTYRGELRSARYQPVLRGTLSSRTYIKQQNAHTQQRLEGLAERAAAVAYALGGKDYQPFLRYAWRDLVKNHAHDSIGGCSTDTVHRQMMGRFDTANRVGQKVIDEALNYLTSRATSTLEVGTVPIVAFNPSPWKRGGAVRVEVSLDADAPLRQRTFGWSGKADLDLEQFVLLDPDGREVPFAIKDSTLRIEDALYRRKAIRRQTIEFEVVGLPALGHKVYGLTYLADQGRCETPDHRSSEAALENEHLRVVAESDGTLTVIDKSTGTVYPGMNRFVDEADAGDEYNFSPPEGQSRVVSTEGNWQVENGEDDRYLVLRADLDLPRGLTEDRSARSEELARCPIVVHVRLPSGSRQIRITTEFYNRVKDHRLRAVFPSGMRIQESIAETAFGTVRRPTTAEDSSGWREEDSTSYAQQRFVRVEDGERGFAVLNKGLTEYEASSNGEIALTLLRSVGWLSRSDLTTRIGHAGPGLATPEAQCSGRQVFEYALVPYSADRPEGSIYREAEEFWLPLQARVGQQVKTASGDREQGARGSYLRVDNENVVLSCLKKAENKDGLVVRLFNTSQVEEEAVLRFGIPIIAAYRTNLNEEIFEQIAPDGDAENELRLTLGKSEIETLMVKTQAAEARLDGGQ